MVRVSESSDKSRVDLSDRITEFDCRKTPRFGSIFDWLVLEHFYCFCLQAKVGRMKEFEASLQSLRGKDVDISQEADEIKVNFYLYFSKSKFNIFFYFYFFLFQFSGLYKLPSADVRRWISEFAPAETCSFTHCETYKLCIPYLAGS